MRIELICPAPPGTLYGNRVTALRWGRILKGLGHRVSIAEQYEGKLCDLLIALHAQRSAEPVFRFHDRYPDRPVIIALTGTDLYRDLRRERRAQQIVELATRLVVFQPLALKELPSHLRQKAQVIYQSVEKTRKPATRGTRRQVSSRSSFFDVCVVGHLRKVKDPFRAALASRRLPASSRIRILQAGTAMAEAMAQKAGAEESRNPRYQWLQGIPRAQARRLIASSRLLVLSSLMEGGANVISEAMVDHVPVLSSRIPGSVGLLGTGYPGYFPVRDTDALARLLVRAESDWEFYERLKLWCSRRAPLFRPSHESARWRRLLSELNPPVSNSGLANAALAKTLRFAVRLGKESRLPE